MPINCDPSALELSASCYKCIPKGMQPEVMIYLLNQILGTGQTPQQLMDASNCFRCVPAGMQEEVMTYLLCQIANGSSEACPQDALLRLTPAMTNGSSAAGFSLNASLSTFPFTGTEIQYLGTAITNTITITNAANLTVIDLPNLVTINCTAIAMTITADPLLTTINLPVFVPTPNKTYNWGISQINAVSVNNFLARCVANAAFTSGTISFNAAGVAAPTGQGLIDKTTLQVRGVVVNTN